MNMQANMDKLVTQLTRVADALEKQNVLEVAFDERLRREREEDLEQRRQEREAVEERLRQQEADEERMMQGLPSEPDDDDPLLH